MDGNHLDTTPLVAHVRLLVVTSSDDRAVYMLSDLQRVGYRTTCEHVATIDRMIVMLQTRTWDAVIALDAALSTEAARFCARLQPSAIFLALHDAGPAASLRALIDRAANGQQCAR